MRKADGGNPQYKHNLVEKYTIGFFTWLKNRLRKGYRNCLTINDVF